MAVVEAENDCEFLRFACYELLLVDRRRIEYYSTGRVSARSSHQYLRRRDRRARGGRPQYAVKTNSAGSDDGSPIVAGFTAERKRKNRSVVTKVRFKRPTVTQEAHEVEDLSI